MKPILAIAIATCFASLASLVVSDSRPGWRFCNKCQVMFSDSRSNVCAAGGKHEAQGYYFRLPFGGQETSTKQVNWRHCDNCGALFYNGRRPKTGRCPAGGGHSAYDAFPYVLPHDVPGTATAQTDWRFCSKCFAMFYDGYPNKGRCAAGEGHLAQGFNFVLPHPR
jgi:hypothetical protein